ncbi:MAG: amidohydrolase [Solirubrobacteraceae bacterium]
MEGVSAPDLLVVSRRIYSMEPDDEGALDGAVAVRGGTIEALLPRQDVDGLHGPRTQIVDVGDRPVMPGFVDPHAHSEVACRATYGTVDVRAPECASIADLQARLADALPDADRTGWVVGQANLFYDRKLKERRLPTRRELDHVSRSVPIAVRAGGHVTILNSAALELAGIDGSYQAPEYSVTGTPSVEFCSCHHQPTGVVKEMDNLLPFPTEDRETIRAALATGMRDMFTANGVTTVGEISETVDGISCMDDLAMAGELPVRVAVYLWSPGTLPIEEGCAWPDQFSLAAGENRVRVAGIKLFADGGYSAASAAVKSEYVHVEHPHCGQIALSETEIERALGLTADARLQLAIHANGDRAQEWLCTMIERHGAAARPGKTSIRIEHAGNFRPDGVTSDWWKRAGIVPAPQPVFLYTFGDYFVDYLGEYGSQGRFPFRTLLDEGWSLSASSDVWVGSEREATSPMFGVWCCVARESYAGRIIDADQALTVHEALRLHTLGAAEALGEQHRKGSLAVGKLADFTVLERDPHTAASADLRRLRADMTILGGEVIWERGIG